MWRSEKEKSLHWGLSLPGATCLPLATTMPSDRGQTLRTHHLLWSPCFEPVGQTVFLARKRILGPGQDSEICTQSLPTGSQATCTELVGGSPESTG